MPQVQQSNSEHTQGLCCSETGLKNCENTRSMRNPVFSALGSILPRSNTSHGARQVSSGLWELKPRPWHMPSFCLESALTFYVYGRTLSTNTLSVHECMTLYTDFTPVFFIRNLLYTYQSRSTELPRAHMLSGFDSMIQEHSRCRGVLSKA